MDEEKWWTGPQAKENGFVDELNDDGDGATYENRGDIFFVNSVSMGLDFDKAPKFVQDGLTAKGAAGQPANTKPAGQPENQQEVQNMNPEIKTVGDLRKAYPELVEQIEQAARDVATNAERERIQSIEDMALPGSETLAAEAKFTKPMSAEDFAKGHREERQDPRRDLSGAGTEGRGHQRHQQSYQHPAQRPDRRRTNSWLLSRAWARSSKGRKKT